MNDFRNIAVVLAGGSGKRFSTGLPKQFYEINGRTVIEHSIDAFAKNEFIDEVWVVMHPCFIGEMQEIKIKNGWRNVTKIIAGGAERHESTLNAVRECGEAENLNLIFHDAARPCVSRRIITDVIEALKNNVAVAVAIPATDTVFRISDEKMSVKEVPERKTMYLAQTPQAFRIGVIRSAYEKFLSNPKSGITDDCGIVKRYLPEIPIALVQGEKTNIKLTTSDDITLICSIFKKNHR